MKIIIKIIIIIIKIRTSPFGKALIKLFLEKTISSWHSIAKGFVAALRIWQKSRLEKLVMIITGYDFCGKNTMSFIVHAKLDCSMCVKLARLSDLCLNK